jgi:hypothetical protein
MLLPQLRHSHVETPADAHETPEKQAQNARPARLAVVGKGADRTPSFPDVSERVTLRDDSTDALDGALARALDLATSRGRLDLVEALLEQIARRRVS